MTNDELRSIVMKHRHLPDPGAPDASSVRDAKAAKMWARKQLKLGITDPGPWQRRYRLGNVPIPGFEEGQWKDMSKAQRNLVAKLYREAQPSWNRPAVPPRRAPQKGKLAEANRPEGRLTASSSHPPVSGPSLQAQGAVHFPPSDDSDFRELEALLMDSSGPGR